MEVKNEKGQIDAEEKIIVITLVVLQHTESVVHFSLGPNSHNFCVQKRTHIKILLDSENTFCIFTSYWPDNFKCFTRNEEQLDFIWDTCSVVTKQVISLDRKLDLDTKQVWLPW